MRSILISLFATALWAQSDMVTDLVLRAKNKPLAPGSAVALEFTDNGAKQTIKEIRHVTGDSLYVNGEKRPLPPQRRIKPIALILQLTGQGNMRVLRQQLIEVLNRDADASHYYGVFLIHYQLNILQEFTNDRKAVADAIDYVASGAQRSFLTRSNEKRRQLQQQAAQTGEGDSAVGPMLARYTLEVAQFARTAANEDSSEGPETGSDFGFATGETRRDAPGGGAGLSNIAFLQNTTRARLVLNSLDSFAIGGGTWPGRKSVAFLTSGLWVPQELDVQFRNLISRANRNQVAFYAFNVTGSTGSDALNVVTSSAIGAVDTGTENRSNERGLNEADRNEYGMRTNLDTPLRTLAESTGGVFTSGSNDVRKPMGVLLEDVDDYHEIVYDPNIQNFDGSLRKMEAKVKDVKVRDRANYFALSRAVLALGNVNTYELPMINALAASPLPRDLEFRSGVVRLRNGKEEVTASAMLEFPLAGLNLTEETKTKTYSGHLSMIVQVKAADGKVVKRFSRDQPLRGKLEQLGALKASNFNFREQFTVTPGRYTVEASVVDQTNKKVGARRTSFLAAAKPSGVAMSSPALVRGFDATAKNVPAEEPFQFQGGRVTPTLGNTVRAVKGAQLALFFTVYPDAAIAEKPAGTVQYLKDGTVVGAAPFELPAADALGRITYVLSSPADTMPPGDYEVKITVKQGSTAAQETAFVKIEPGV